MRRYHRIESDNAASLFVPPKWRGLLLVNSEEGLRFLGRPTLTEMIREWCRHRELNENETKEARNRLRVYQGFNDTRGVEMIRRHISDKLEKLMRERIKIDDVIATLNILQSQSTEKPLFPRCRPVDSPKWFRPGDSVVIFDDRSESVFTMGTVCKCDKANVYVELQGERPTLIPRARNKSAVLCYKQTSPELLKLWELKYLSRRPGFAEKWVTEGIMGDHRFNKEAFLSALQVAKEIVNSPLDTREFLPILTMGAIKL